MKISLLSSRYVIHFHFIFYKKNFISSLLKDYRDHPNKNHPVNDPIRERQIRDSLINSRYIAFTPSRYNNGQRLTNYDDR